MTSANVDRFSFYFTVMSDSALIV